MYRLQVGLSRPMKHCLGYFTSVITSVYTLVRRDAALVGLRLDEPEKRSLRAAPFLGQDSLFPPAMIQTAIKADREEKNDLLLYKNLG